MYSGKMKRQTERWNVHEIEKGDCLRGHIAWRMAQTVEPNRLCSEPGRRFSNLLSSIERVSLRPLSSDTLQCQVSFLYSKSVVVSRETDDKNTFMALGILPSP